MSPNNDVHHGPSIVELETDMNSRRQSQSNREFERYTERLMALAGKWGNCAERSLGMRTDGTYFYKCHEKQMSPTKALIPALQDGGLMAADGLIL